MELPSRPVGFQTAGKSQSEKEVIVPFYECKIEIVYGIFSNIDKIQIGSHFKSNQQYIF